MSDEGGPEPSSTVWAGAYRESMGAGGPGCPDTERLARLVLGEIEGEDRLALGDHVVTCRRCAGLVADGMRLHEETTRGAGPAAAATFPVAYRRRASLLGVAAMLLACVGLSVYLWRRTGLPIDPATSERGPALSLFQGEPPDGAALTEAPERFAWPAEERARIYWLTLYDVESTPLWQSVTGPETSLRLPVEVRARLRAGQIYYWRVSFLVGLETRQSPLRRFSLSP